MVWLKLIRQCRDETMSIKPPEMTPETRDFVERAHRDFEPVNVTEVELSQPLPALSMRHSDGECIYKHANITVKLHTHPLGVVRVTATAEDLHPADYVDAIYDELSEAINAHLAQDNLPAITSLSPAGIPAATDDLPCLEYRRQVLADPPMMSVVVPTRDRTQWLEICMPSLVDQDYPNYEILIVDNAPSDDSTARFIQDNYGDDPRVRYIMEPRPGTSHARNRGLAEARGEIIARADDDIRASRNWLSSLAAGFAMGPHIACVNGLVIAGQLETPAQDWFEQFGGFNRGYEQRLFDLGDNRPESMFFPYTVGMTGTGANMAVRKSVYLEVGGVDENVGPGKTVSNGEDIDTLFRIVMAGYSILYQPDAMVYHYHRRDYNKLRKQIYGYGLGFTAFLIKCLMRHPLMIPGFVLKAFYGLYLMLNPRSIHNEQKTDTYPADLVGLERKGMLIGPYLYLKVLWQNLRKPAASAPVAPVSASSTGGK